MPDRPVCDRCSHDRTEHSSLAGCLAPGCECELSPVDILAPALRGNLPEGRARRDAGVAAAGTTAPGALVTAWRANAEDRLAALISMGYDFTADDLIGSFGVGMPPRPNMVGALFRVASQAGRIVPVGYSQGTRPESHARVQRVWRGV